MDGAPDTLLRLMPAPDKSCSIDSATESSNPSRFGTTCEPLTADRGAATLMLSLAAFPAKTSASVAPAPESTASGQDCGATWPESFTKFDLSSRCWKTRQHSLLGGLEEFSETWPKWGWMHAGECFERQPLEQPTTAPGFTWLLTPTAQSWKAWTFRNPLALIRKNHADGNLQEQLMRLYQRMTTPRCQEILMMWPEGWTASKPLEMAGFHQWLQEQRGYFSTPMIDPIRPHEKPASRTKQGFAESSPGHHN